MADEVKHAFEHPLERSLASAQDPALDRISLRDHIVAVEIGAFQAERDMTQRISFNVVVEVRHAAKDLGDDVDLILSYDRVTEAIDIELAAERLNLLETLAERVADRILKEPQAERVFVRIEKLDRGGGALGVEIVRAMSDVSSAASASDAALNAWVVFLSEAAMSSRNVSNWIDQLTKTQVPLVLVVPPARSDLSARTRLAKAQVTLLAMEQNAWTFAATEPRCAVVETRTELDWACKNEQISVWAPQKFVMDAVESPLHLVDDPVALADWFCSQIGALELVVVGEELPTSPMSLCRAVAVESEAI